MCNFTDKFSMHIQYTHSKQSIRVFLKNLSKSVYIYPNPNGNYVLESGLSVGFPFF